jgi:c(7)-type cytochrome triheme protein
MEEIALGKRAQLPALAAFRAPVWSATTVALLMCLIFMGASVVLAYDGIRRREAPVQLAEGSGAVDTNRGLAELKLPGPIAIKTGPTSPGQCIFSHARHVNAKDPSCSTCHSGLFRMLPSTPDIAPEKKMRNCGTCHDGVKAVGILQKERCDSCHAKT